MFKFQFFDENAAANDNTEMPPEEETKRKAYEAKEIVPDLSVVKEILSVGHVNLFRCGKDINLRYLSSNIIDTLIEKSKHSPILKAEEDYSDLITGVYEGGLKIWECTYDLVKFINDSKVQLEQKTVLDLGCGAGIVGILAAVNNCRVHFQDYNEEIITYVTIPNLYLNMDDIEICKFFAGDWISFLSLSPTSKMKYDYIFTSETIYNPESYSKLHSVFKHRLKKNGAVYLAAKTHYFGVGGGLRQFEDYITNEGVFTHKTCWRCTEGVEREILEITFKNKNSL